MKRRGQHELTTVTELSWLQYMAANQREQIERQDQQLAQMRYEIRENKIRIEERGVMCRQVSKYVAYDKPLLEETRRRARLEWQTMRSSLLGMAALGDQLAPLLGLPTRRDRAITASQDCPLLRQSDVTLLILSFLFPWQTTWQDIALLQPYILDSSIVSLLSFMLTCRYTYRVLRVDYHYGEKLSAWHRLDYFTLVKKGCCCACGDAHPTCGLCFSASLCRQCDPHANATRISCAECQATVCLACQERLGDEFGHCKRCLRFMTCSVKCCYSYSSTFCRECSSTASWDDYYEGVIEEVDDDEDPSDDRYDEDYSDDRRDS
jgi:hypothetical protein